ncbi:hypothetical protein EVAR_63820_1 [Eumeta japonica]|uniref:Uncharacterized protein n=1 Tax=Eumeta variegata TaxID=151549 RepID=A0A4C1ZGD1_EUMVA|nr:hypothetical protein EVAR_63820_1 [Eumeta japonica]
MSDHARYSVPKPLLQRNAQQMIKLSLSPKSQRRPDLRYFIKAESFSMHVPNTDTLKVRYRQSLPGFHAITGCDFNPAFFRKGKSKPYKTLKKYPEYQEAFKNFETDGEGDIDDDEAIDWSNSDEENENIDDNDEN